MMRGLLALALVGVLFSAFGQHIPIGGWTPINERPVSQDPTISYPKVASFSNGDYVVVYTVLGDTAYEKSQVAAKIFNKNGSVKVSEFLLSQSSGPHYAPNVIVIKGDIAVVLWRSIELLESFNFYLFSSNGVLVNNYVLPNLPGLISTNINDPLGLFSLDSSQKFGFTLPSKNDTVNAVKIAIATVGQVTPVSYNFIPFIDIPVGIYDARTNNSFFMLKSTGGAYSVTSYTGYEPDIIFRRGAVNQVTKATYAVPVLLESTDLVVFVQTTLSSNDIYLSRLQQNMYSMNSDTIFNRAYVKTSLMPSAVHIGYDYVLVAHSSNLNSVIYQLGKATVLNGFSPVGPELSLNDLPTEGISMARIGSSTDVVVTALKASKTQIMIRRLSLCGNGVLDINEQCDGSTTCTSQCTCLSGMDFANGKCVDVCGNGIVTGSEECDSGLGCNATTCKCMEGYQPYVNRQECQRIPSVFVPSVGPSLDCLNFIDSNNMKLYFSFVNNNGFDLTIRYGKLNYFIPTDIAGDRPTFFAAGNSLTYPVSPYNVTIARTTSSVTWILGSYNLTVDLSGNKAEALQCPKDAGFVITIATFDTLNKTDVQTILDNLANKYNFSASRLDATYRLSIAGNSTQPNIYSITVTIVAATNSSEKSGQDILSALFADLKDEKQDLNNDLTQGLEGKNPLIKDVSPSPTGVEVRGQQRDIPPMTEFVPVFDAQVSLASQILRSLSFFLSAIFFIVFF